MPFIEIVYLTNNNVKKFYKLDWKSFQEIFN